MLCTPQIELPITSPADRLKVGYIRIRVYDNQTALNGRFGNLLDRIPFKWSYPLGVLEDLFVGADKRRRGYGRLGLRLADEAFRNRHVRTGVLKIGWSNDEKWDEAKAWKTEVYAKSGWIRLQWKFPEPVFMAKNYPLVPSD